MSRPTLDTASSYPLSHTRLSRSLAGLSRTFLLADLNRLCSPNPGKQALRVWALPRSLAATYGITFVFSSSGYLDVSVHRVPSVNLWIQLTVLRVSLSGLPHSDICGS